MSGTNFLKWFATFSISFLIIFNFTLSAPDPISVSNQIGDKHLIVKAQSANRQYRPRSNSITKPRESLSKDFSSWSYWSKCTRACEGGISTRRRTCYGINCDGPTQEFLVCNANPCQFSKGDYRVEQCARRNGHNIAGKVSNKWIPLPDYNDCQLKCKSVDLVETYVFGKVEDGTKCGPTNHVCLDGRCLPVGCDSIIGSNRKFDKCGVCGGHNSTCHQIRGTFKQKPISWNSAENYQEIVRLPEGAYDILITDNTSNHLSLQDRDGNFLINGNKTVGWPGTYDLGGYFANYSRVGHDESIFISGPILENLTVATFIVDSTNGIKYQYLVSKYNQRKYRTKANGGGRGYPVYRPTPNSRSRPTVSKPNLPPGYNEVIPDSKSIADRNTIPRTTASSGYEKPYRQTPPQFEVTTPNPYKNRWNERYPPASGQNTTTWKIKNERDRNRPDSDRNKDQKKGKCPRCVRVKDRLKNFCTSDFVIQGRILNTNWYPDKRATMKEMMYDVNVIETYKVSTDLVLNAREYLFIPSSNPCACPRLRKNVEYVIMGNIDRSYRSKEDRLIINATSFIRKFSEKRHLEMMKLKQQSYERCRKFVPKSRRY